MPNISIDLDIPNTLQHQLEALSDKELFVLLQMALDESHERENVREK